jgi:hypothetical protein
MRRRLPHLASECRGTLCAKQRLFIFAQRIAHAVIVFWLGDGWGLTTFQMQMQLQPPRGVAEDLVRNALGFRGTTTDGDACSG